MTKEQRIIELKTAWGIFLGTHFSQPYINHLQALFNGSVSSNYQQRMNMINEIYHWVYELVTPYRQIKETEINESENPELVVWDFEQFLIYRPTYTLEQLLSIKE
jgi:hypothetical protein